MGRGETTGNVLERHEEGGWSKVPGSVTLGPNGIEVSSDGRWIYVAGWPTKALVRLSRGSATLKRDSVKTGHLADNLTWTSDGWICRPARHC